MSPRAVRALPVPHADGLPLLDPLREALSGVGPVLVPHPADRAPDPAATAPLVDDEDDDADPTVAVVSTTGSTGRAKHVLLPASALLASAAATHDRLGGSGRWLLAVPAATVAGLQVLVRSLVAGSTPVVVDLAGGFGVGEFAAAADRLAGASSGRRYTSLVPTQLHRLLADGPDGDGARSLRSLDAVLVGGAALPEELAARAAAAGVRVVTTYGMTETCGGCVYDGVPLPGVGVELAPLDGAPDGVGRVVLRGPVVARGYRGAALERGAGDGHGGPVPTGEGFHAGTAGRSFRTADRGRWQDGRLLLLGRTDDVVVSGGVNVSLDAVTRTVQGLPGVEDCLAVAVPDPRWGAVVGLLLVPGPGGGPADEALRAAVRAALGRASAPRLVRRVPAVPTVGVGKPDRRAAAALLSPADAPRPDLGDHVLDPDPDPELEEPTA